MGCRFDLSVFPGYYRGRIDVPNVKWESGWHPWEAAPDLSYYSIRHELEWKDQVYVEASYHAVDETTRLVRCECVNNTDTHQSLALHLFAGLSFPEVAPGRDEVFEPVRVDLPAKHVFVRAVDYENLKFATVRPTDSLVTDALKRGEILGQGFVGGSGVGQGFGGESGDRVTHVVEVGESFSNACLIIRLRCGDSKAGNLTLSGLIDGHISVERDSFHLVEVDLGALSPGSYELSIVGNGDGSVELDSLVIVESSEAERIEYVRTPRSDKPVIANGLDANSLTLHFPALDEINPDLRYCIGWDYENFAVREFVSDHLDTLIRRSAHDHVQSRLWNRWTNETDGAHYSNVFLRPIVLEPESVRIIYACVAGDVSERAQSACHRVMSMSFQEKEALRRESRERRVTRTGNASGSHLVFSQELMASTTLTNLVYPVKRGDAQVIHNTPGRWWNSLYTWDSGFIGLGLLELDAKRAIECLNMYCTDPDDEHRAFIHHGSPVPVQIYLFQELWNRTADPELLTHFYPGLKRFHEFLAGRLGSSTTDKFGSHLLATWDYFYNSGGWDDYPPQVHVHRSGLTGSVAPASNTAHAIRTAKILRAAAHAGGLDADVRSYDADIERFTDALQRYATDPESCYFSYVNHTDDGEPSSPLYHESGANYNMGLDGAYPLVAGICTEEQEKRLLSCLQDDSRLWTDIGLSTVDRSAPYYRIDGYWNGSVWFPHQWFYWKTCLDLGYPDFAWKIARTGLELWSDEVRNSYNCYEHFIIETRRGAGWHQFSGLSTPVLLWYGAYYDPGRLTFGFDVWVRSIKSDAQGMKSVDLTTLGAAGRSLSVMYCCRDGSACRLSWNGKTLSTRELLPSVVTFELPCMADGRLEIQEQ